MGGIGRPPWESECEWVVVCISGALACEEWPYGAAGVVSASCEANAFSRDAISVMWSVLCTEASH